MKYDFGGWATRNDLLCTDGRTIRSGAFSAQDGDEVPLVWNHNYTKPENVLGMAHLENRDDGVYAYCTFNDNTASQAAKEAVKHGDVRSLSIMANQLKQKGSDVLHGTIREVSLVLAGANPGAFIDEVLAHGDDDTLEAIILGYDECITLYHGDDDYEDDEDDESDVLNHSADDNDDDDEDDETVGDIIDSMNEKQKTVLYTLLGKTMDENLKQTEGGNENMKHNVFDDSTSQQNDTLGISIEDQNDILSMAKDTRVSSLQKALALYAEDKGLKHDALTGGFTQPSEVEKLFPEYKDLHTGAPELVTNDQGWISTVLSKVSKSPISRVRTSYVDIRNLDSLRAKGYMKGKKKALTGNFALARRTTDPQTIYVKNALNRDDIVDITDFDYVAWLYGIDKMMLNEEIATAIMLGDDRTDEDADKIFPEHIRPVWTDDELYTIHVDLDTAGAKAAIQGTDTSKHFGDNYIFAENVIAKVLHAREKFKGTGTPDLYCTPTLLNKMLLAKDMNGRRIYNTKAELESTLNVGHIITAEQFAGKKRKDEDAQYWELEAILVNLNDYTVGATKGGEITHFTQFDIDFNQQKSLIETRMSGSLSKLWSAIVLEEKTTGPEAP